MNVVARAFCVLALVIRSSIYCCGVCKFWRRHQVMYLKIAYLIRWRSYGYLMFLDFNYAFLGFGVFNAIRNDAVPAVGLNSGPLFKCCPNNYGCYFCFFVENSLELQIFCTEIEGVSKAYELCWLASFR